MAVIKGCKSIAEYYIRRWMAEQNFAEGYFTLEMNGNIGTITDKVGGKLTLAYNPEKKAVEVIEK